MCTGVTESNWVGVNVLVYTYCTYVFHTLWFMFGNCIMYISLHAHAHTYTHTHS